MNEMLGSLRHDWQQQEVADLFALPMNDLLFKAQTCLLYTSDAADE